MASPTVLISATSEDLSSTPSFSSTIWDSSARSRESTSRSSKVASRLTSSLAGPKSAMASTTVVSTCSGVTCVDMLVSSGWLGAHAAVDVERGAGDIPGAIRAQEGDARGDLLGPAGAAGRAGSRGSLPTHAFGTLGLLEAGRA